MDENTLSVFSKGLKQLADVQERNDTEEKTPAQLMLDAMDTFAKMTQTTHLFMQSCVKYFNSLLNDRRGTQNVVYQPNTTFRPNPGKPEQQSFTSTHFLFLFAT